MTPRVLLLPGWHNSGPTHWQSLWAKQHGYARVAQHDWERPLRGDWMAQLEIAVLAATEPSANSDAPARVVLVAHSLGCHLVAAWAAHSPHAHRVHAALLVAPPDLSQPALQHVLHSWRPPVRATLPFPSVVLASQDDPYGALSHAQALSRDWGARCVDMCRGGHLNADSSLGDWPEGHAWLESLISSVQTTPSQRLAHHGH